jgi:signal transduction histidine kinase
MEELALLTKIIFFSLFLILLLSVFIIYLFSLFKKRIEQMNLEKELETQKNSLANLEAILSAQEKERKRIADDLHDEIGATLTLVQKNLNYIRNKPQQNEHHAESELSQSIQLVDRSIQSIRNISKELIPNQVIQLGIVKAIQHHVEIMSKSAFSNCVFETDVAIELNIESEEAVDLYRIYLELITNIIKHSGSTKIDVKCTKIENLFVLVLMHNGIGLTEQDYLDKQANSMGLGLKSVSNRVKRIGANIHFEKTDDGYSIELRYPFNA